MKKETSEVMMKYIKFLGIVLLLLVCIAASAQKTNDVYVDKNGIMRWGKTKAEVRAFCVNYTAPFAHGYRAAKKKGISLEQAIDNDVYHFARLGFGLYRVHVWDCEISDSDSLRRAHSSYICDGASTKSHSRLDPPCAAYGVTASA